MPTIKLFRPVSLLLAYTLTMPFGLFGGAIAVPNYSFESPTTSFVSINVDSWQKTPLPAGYAPPGGYDWTEVVGVFKNTPASSGDHIDNCDGNQALYVFADTYAGLFQDYDSLDYSNRTHQFTAVYLPGRSYHLTVGIAGMGGPLLPTATLQLSLYYRDDQANQITITAATVTNTPTVFSNHTHFVDCNVDVPAVQASDPWAGRHIGIQFLSTVDTNSQGGYWDLDNVRLVEGPMLLNPGYTNGQFSFSLLGQPGATFEIQSAAGDIADAGSWTSAGFLTNVSRTTPVTLSAGAAQTFYRARQLQ